MTILHWHFKSFDQLTTDELYDLLKLRVDVFVVEQNCPYPELDNKDRHPDTRHLTGKNKAGKILAYLRILPPDLNYNHPGIGRVVVDKTQRGRHLCRKMVQKAVDFCDDRWPGQGIKIGAQAYLTDFYISLGFNPVSDVYLEDGIPHVDMVKKSVN